MTRTGLFALALLVFASDARAQCQDDKLLPPAPSAHLSYGTAVDLEGGTLMAGPCLGQSVWYSGVAVYAADPSGWNLAQVLTPPSPESGDGFGRRLDHDGARVVIGADAASGGAGAAYVFERNGPTWAFVQKLTPSVPAPRFGITVAIDGDRIAVGATSASTSLEGAYVFERVGGVWVETAALFYPGPIANRGFASSLIFDGSSLLVGVMREEMFPPNNSGAVYFYEDGPSGWSFDTKLVPVDSQPYDNFGRFTALSGDVLWVGLIYATAGQTVPGAVAMYERVGSSWVERTILNHPFPANGVHFGASLAADGARLVVGSRLDSTSGDAAGSVFVYDAIPQAPWVELAAHVVPADVADGQWLGEDVALQGDTVVAGAPHDAEAATNAGAVYVFDTQFSSATSYCTGAPNSVGAGALIDSVGPASITANAFSLSVSGAPPNVLGIFYYGPASHQVPFGNGFSCVAPGGTGVFRLTPAFQTDAGGSALRQVDFQSAPAGVGPGSITPGSTWFFQAWYRDPNAGGAGFNLSDGLEVGFCY